MTPEAIEELHTYLAIKGYKKDEFAADLWAFCYGLHDEWTRRNAKETSIRQSIIRALTDERRRVKKER